MIVSCAVTGSVHVPSQSPHLPVTPEEIAEAAIGAVRAGAAIVHLHARDPQTGRPTSDPGVYAQFLPQIADGCDGVINMTTGGAVGMSLDQRLAAVGRFGPELCSLNMGSMNLGLFAMASSIKSFQHDWEEPYLEGSRDLVFKNTFKDVEEIVTRMTAQGTRFEFECYDVGHLYNLAHFADRGLVEPPFFV